MDKISYYMVDLVMWPKFSNSIICVRDVIITLKLKGFDQKNSFFDASPWFKVTYLRLVLVMALKLKV